MLSRNEVKYIQSLFQKKNRDEAKVFIAEGTKIIEELLHADFTIQKIYAVNDWANAHTALKNVITISEEELKKISNFETPNKVLAVIEKKPSAEITGLKNNITLLLDGIQDPGNLGTIIRTADWFGIENIIASNDTADVYNPKVVQSTMGSIARVNVHYADITGFLSANKIHVYGAVLSGEDISTKDKIKEGIVIIGNESKGISKEVQPFIQTKISIPKFGNAESLNAAVATGIILFELINPE